MRIVLFWKKQQGNLVHLLLPTFIFLTVFIERKKLVAYFSAGCGATPLPVLACWRSLISLNAA
jgi:hypothetical protein